MDQVMDRTSRLSTKKSLSLQVMDKDNLTKDDMVGCCYIDIADVS